MPRVGALFVLICSLVIGALAINARQAPYAVACTGGGPGPFEELATLPFIFVGDVVEVGGPVNRAATLTPTNTATATATPTPGNRLANASATATSPFSPPFGVTPVFQPRASVDLTGVGATLRVVHAYAGALYAPGAEVLIDDATRADLERFLRQREVQNGVSDCTADRFVPRYVPGRSYLIFAVLNADHLTTVQLFPIAGEDIVLHDPLLATTFLDTLEMTSSTAQRFFPGVEAMVVSTFATITADRVPLADVLRAIASLRGDPSVFPPETGSAGLAARR